MKKEEKTELTRRRILNAAMQEFGSRGYAGATLNAICKENNIAKGLLYHNFAGKDELYLECVSSCFSQLTGYLQTQEIGEDLHQYLKIRMRFFSEHPLCARLFFEAVLQPPAALAGKIKQLKATFDCLNRRIYQGALRAMTLRQGVSEADAMEYYEIIQEMFNGYFSSPAYPGKDLQTIMEEHERRLAQMLDFMLYGIVERGLVR
ncbi:MAG: TetR/AcrR family transcriptional regulator [Oscillospiraceae bacterium]